ncbi:hypothetical protein PCE1_003225 [Barthelona sp. PCE]
MSLVDIEESVSQAPSTLPIHVGTQEEITSDSLKVAVITYGCAHNQNDSERIMTACLTNGYSKSEDPANCDIRIVNGCTVKGPSEEKFFKAIEDGKELNQIVIAAGCVSQVYHGDARFDSVGIIGTDQISKAHEVVDSAIAGNPLHYIDTIDDAELDSSNTSVSYYEGIGIVPISIGCQMKCTYCQTRLARGSLRSFPLNVVMAKIDECQKRGCTEVWLVGEDVGAYGIDKGLTIVDLLEEISATYTDDRLLFKMGHFNPPYMYKHKDAILEILLRPCFFNFMHLPLQAGSNSVLRHMKRGYTVEQWRECVDGLHEQGAAVLTDIIVAYPTETEEDFEETYKAVVESNVEFFNLARYFPRPHTEAAELKMLHGRTRKARSRRLHQYQYNMSPCAHLLDQEVVCYVSPQPARFENQALTHMKNGLQVIINKTDQTKAGSKVRVKVTEIKKWCALGQVIEVLRE